MMASSFPFVFLFVRSVFRVIFSNVRKISINEIRYIANTSSAQFFKSLRAHLIERAKTFPEKLYTINLPVLFSYSRNHDEEAAKKKK